MARIVATGRDALVRAAEAASANLFGPVEGLNQSGMRVSIPVGTYDTQQHLYILGQSGGEVYTLKDTQLTATTQGDFIRGYVIGQVNDIIYQRTKWIVPVGQAVMGFAMAAAGGFAVGGAIVIANVAVTAVKFCDLCQRHPNEVSIVEAELPVTLGALSRISAICPRLFACLCSVMARADLDAIRNYRPTAGGVASTLGSMLAGATSTGATQFGFAGLEILLVNGLSGVLQSARQTGFHAGLGAAAGTFNDSGGEANALIDQLRRRGVHVSDIDARAIRRELSSPEGMAELHLLQRSVQRLSPAMVTLYNSFESL